jgi:methyl coenzyme M reductase subunit C
MSSSSSLVLKTGSGQYKPRQSKVLLGLDFIIIPQELERNEWNKKPFVWIQEKKNKMAERFCRHLWFTV